MTSSLSINVFNSGDKPVPGGRDTFAAGIRAVRDAEILAAFRSLRWQGGCHDDRRVR
jgi:hypothetical protein